MVLIRKNKILKGIKNQGARTHKNIAKVNKGKNLARCKCLTWLGQINPTKGKATETAPAVLIIGSSKKTPKKTDAIIKIKEMERY